MLNGRPFRFIGANVRGLLHYGDLQILRHSRFKHVAEQLDAAKSMGAKVIRVFGANRHIVGDNRNETANRLERALQEAAQRDMYIIFAFTNVYHDVAFDLPGDEGFYEHNSLNRAWFEGGYQNNYWPFVEHIVERFKDHPRIFAWELGNELKASGPQPHQILPDLFIQFAEAVSNRIRQLDSNHLITTGIINSGNLGAPLALGQKLYQLPNLDFLTAHVFYRRFPNPDEHTEITRADDEADLARLVNKPFVIEEMGIHVREPNRKQKLKRHLHKWFDQQQVAGFMQWGLMGTPQDIGDGDNEFGLHRNHSDYNDLVSVYRNRAQAL